MGETRRLQLIISYDGRDFAGWQSQKHGNTIQDQLEKALSKICGHKVAVIGAGRTDAGVHALGQCAHANVPAGKLSPPQWLRALNGTLPPTIRILRVRFVSRDFHARFSAKAKLYRYRIANTPILLPFELGRAWHIALPLNLQMLKDGTALFVGRHDFSGFAASRDKVEIDPVRTIESIRITSRSNIIAVEIWGDGFLYKMARMMVGALAACALGKNPLEAIAMRLEPAAAHAHPGSAPTSVASPNLPRAVSVAPAAGLYLVRIRY
jgi:tRNA pseudouridine38-40 synthase